MQFGWMSAFWWLLLAVPVVLLYILKVRLRRVPVSTTFFWEQVFQEKTARSIWQKLRHLISLLLQLAFLLLVVLALSDPYLPNEWMQSRRLIVVIDDSASMQADDVEPSRLAAAKEKAGDLIDSLRWRDEMAVITAASVPKVQTGLTSHQKTLRAALEAVTTTDGTGSLDQAIALARRLISDHKHAEIHVFSDTDRIEGVDAGDKVVKLHRVGTPAANVGITRFQVRRSLLDPIGYEILVEVGNFSKEPSQFRLNADLGDEIVDVIPLKLEPGEVWNDVLSKASASGGLLEAKIDVKDALAADNVARALLPKREQQPVLLYSDGNLFLQKVFESIPYVDLASPEPLTGAVPNGAIAVYYGRVPETIPNGNVLVIDPQNSTDRFDVAAELESSLAAEQDDESELMTYVRLQNVNMPKARKLTFKGDAHVLVKTIDGEPLYASMEKSDGKLLVLTANLNEGDLPLRTAFPIMISNAIGWFQGTKGEWRQAYASGDVVELKFDEGELDADPGHEMELVVVSPSGNETVAPGDLQQITLGPLEETGVWQVRYRPVAKPDDADETKRDQGVLLREIACNLDSDAESNLAVPDDETEEPGVLSAGFGSRPVWFYLAMLAFLLVTSEWYLYQRRWIS